jgi:hypothetical protein
MSAPYRPRHLPSALAAAALALAGAASPAHATADLTVQAVTCVPGNSAALAFLTKGPGYVSMLGPNPPTNVFMVCPLPALPAESTGLSFRYFKMACLDFAADGIHVVASLRATSLGLLPQDPPAGTVLTTGQVRCSDSGLPHVDTAALGAVMRPDRFSYSLAVHFPPGTEFVARVHALMLTTK